MHEHESAIARAVDVESRSGSRRRGWRIWSLGDRNPGHDREPVLRRSTDERCPRCRRL